MAETCPKCGYAGVETDECPRCKAKIVANEVVGPAIRGALVAAPPRIGDGGSDPQVKRYSPLKALLRWWRENPWGVCVLSFLVGWISMVIAASSDALVIAVPVLVAAYLGFLVFVASLVLGILAPMFEKKRSVWKILRGLAVAVVIACLGIILVSAIPGLVSSPRQSKYARTGADTKTVVTQAIVYAKDKGVYPTSLKVLRDSGYANVGDSDPWNNPYLLSPALASGGKPKDGDDVYVFSKGPKGTGTYPPPLTGVTGEDGSVGYSSVYGSFQGR